MSVTWLTTSGPLPHKAQGLWQYSAGNTDSFLGITLHGARDHLKKSSFDANDNDLITAYIKSATRAAGTYMNRAVKVERWALNSTEWPASGIIAASKGNYISGLTVEYYDQNNDVQTLVHETDYFYNQAAGVLYVKMQNTPPVSSDLPLPIGVTALYGWNASVPEDVKGAIKLMVGDMYEIRQSKFSGNSVAQFPEYIKDLLNPYRLLSI